MNFTKVSDAVPECNTNCGLISRTVIFKVDGKEYAGYYHCNGFFYCIEKTPHNEPDYLFYAWAKDVGLGNPRCKETATEWRYLR